MVLHPPAPGLARTLPTFAALDFETANQSPESACAVGIVRVVRGVVVERAYELIRPPTRNFEFTHIHGITWGDVADKPSFGDVWPRIRHLCENVNFVAAHHAEFDERVLRACCARASLPVPRAPFSCTVALARRAFRIYPTNLGAVAERLGITLRHHHALSDAEACAQIVVRAHAA